MTKPTAGKWEAKPDTVAFCSWEVSNKGVALGTCWFDPVYPEKARANAELIVSLQNAAVDINPSNPMAVAKALPFIVQALAEILANMKDKMKQGQPRITGNLLRWASAGEIALAELGKEETNG